MQQRQELTKQQKGGAVRAARAGARRVRVAIVVAWVADRNRGKEWKFIRIEAAKRLGISHNKIEKMSEATQTFRWAQRKFAQWPWCDRPYFPANFDVDLYIKLHDPTPAVADRMANLSPEQRAAAIEWLESLPAMARGRKPAL